MTEDDVRERTFAMPIHNPAYPPGPYRFVDREYLIITYRTDPEVLRKMIPAPLKLAEPGVKFEFINMPDSTGFGHYCESGQVRASMAAPAYLLKIIPHVDGTPRICELVRYGLTDIRIKGALAGPGALDLRDHALAPVADLPVLEVLSTVHILADLTLPLGTVVHDYLAR